MAARGGQGSGSTRAADGHAPSAAARPAHLGHRPLQFPLHLLHAEGGVRRGLPVPAARASCSPSRRSRASRASSSSLGVKKIRLTGGEPLLRTEHRAPGRDARARFGATSTSRSPPTARCSRSKAQALKAAGLKRVTVSLDSLDDATFRAMNDADFPVANVLEGIDAAAAAGLAPIKINMVVKRGVNDASDRADGAPLPRHRPHRALHRVHGRRQHQRLAHGRRGSRRAEIVRRSARDSRSSRSTPNYARRSRRALALPRRRAARSASSPRSRRRSAATARARGSPPTARSTPACSRSDGHDLQVAAARRREPTRRSRDAIAAVWHAARATATPRSAPRRRRRRRKVEMSLHRRLTMSNAPYQTAALRRRPPGDLRRRGRQRDAARWCRRRSPASIRSRSTSTSARSSR